MNFDGEFVSDDKVHLSQLEITYETLIFHIDISGYLHVTLRNDKSRYISSYTAELINCQNELYSIGVKLHGVVMYDNPYGVSNGAIIIRRGKIFTLPETTRTAAEKFLNLKEQPMAANDNHLYTFHTKKGIRVHDPRLFDKVVPGKGYENAPVIPKIDLEKENAILKAENIALKACLSAIHLTANTLLNTYDTEKK